MQLRWKKNICVNKLYVTVSLFFGVSSLIFLSEILKPSFHMTGKSQTIEDFTVSRPSQILPRYRVVKSPGIHR